MFFVRQKNHGKHSAEIHVSLASIHGNLNLFIGCNNPSHEENKNCEKVSFIWIRSNALEQLCLAFLFPPMANPGAFTPILPCCCWHQCLLLVNKASLSSLSPFFWLPSLRPHYSYSPSIGFETWAVGMKKIWIFKGFTNKHHLLSIPQHGPPERSI